MTNELGDLTEYVDNELMLIKGMMNRSYLNENCRFHLQKSIDNELRYNVEVTTKGTYKILFSRALLKAESVIEVANRFKITLNVTK